jgi:signal transduction histidine kinase/ActR/RegA family two-component response regulator
MQMQGSVAEVSLEVVHSDGSRIPMLFNAVRRQHDGSTVDQLAVMVVADRHKYERELLLTRGQLRESIEKLSDEDRRKDEFLATLAHELRNPLAPLRNVAQLLKLKQFEDPQVTWARDVLDRQLGHLSVLVDDLMEISRVTQGKLALHRQRVALSDALQGAVEAARPLIASSGHDLSLAFADTPILLDADPTRLTQMVQNLLNNAAKYTPRGGRISLSTSREEGEAVIRVRDSGIGIPQEHLARVFEMFSQLEPARERFGGGLGIGLSLVRGLATLHGGSVRATSEGPGKGSEFTIRLPLATDEEILPATTPLAPSWERLHRVLLVDDNADAAESLAMLFKLRGHYVRTAIDALGALAIATEFRPEIAVFDIGLPDIDGYELARRIRAEPWGSDILLVALTGWGQGRDRALAHAAGFDRHFTKPLKPEDMNTIVSLTQAPSERIIAGPQRRG